MTIRDDIKRDTITALREGRSGDVEALRYLQAQIQKREYEFPQGVMTEEDVLAVLLKEAKKKEEARVLFAQGGRSDLVKGIENEIKLLKKYLPPLMAVEEVEAVVDQLIMANPTFGFGELMKKALEKIGTGADGKTVADIVKRKLQC